MWGRQKGVTPICSDFLRFAPPRFVPICSGVFQFVPIYFQNKSEQIRETPFCRPLLQVPETAVLLLRPRENDENDESGGCHAGKCMVCQRHGFLFPEEIACTQSGPNKKTMVVVGRCCLSGPLRLRVQSRSRTRLRIAASIAFLFCACFKGVLDTIAPQSRG